MDAANDWLLLLLVAERVVIRPAKDALVLADVMSLVVMDAAKDWLLVVTVEDIESNRPAAELLLFVTVTFVVVMLLANDALLLLIDVPCVVILAENDPEDVDCAAYTSVIYAAEDAEFADTVTLNTPRLDENDWEFWTMVDAREADVEMRLLFTAVVEAAADAELALMESIMPWKLPLIEPDSTVMLACNAAKDALVSIPAAATADTAALLDAV